MNKTLSLSQFNSLPSSEAEELLFLCCGSRLWASNLCRERPFSSLHNLYLKAETQWNKLSEDEWLSAFKHHPKIGDLESLKKKFASTKTWAKSEQGSVTAAPDALLKALSCENENYEKRHGFIFIVCATGKSAEEMLSLLQTRIHNDTKTEINIAAIEQAKITRLRLEKLLHETD